MSTKNVFQKKLLKNGSISVQHEDEIDELIEIRKQPWLRQKSAVDQWNPTIDLLLSAPTLHEIFENQVEKSSDKPAVVYKETILTYNELNNRSNQLAHFLHSSKNSIEPDTLIALFLDKNELMLISILGVWKSGAAYVPIDPSYPDDRVKFILQDTKAEIVIANHRYASRIKNLVDTPTSIIEIDHSNTAQLLNEQSSANFKSKADEDSLAYVIYTSGTTGKPKGVLIEHKGVVNLRNDLVDRYFKNRSDQQQAILFLANYVFDFSVEQLILSILNSNKLILIDCSQTFDEQFYDYLNSNELTYLSGTPTYLQQIDLSKLKYLRMVTVAGEAFSKLHFEKIRKEFKEILNNAYGITETTVYNTVCRFEPEAKYKNSLGQLLSNTKKYVLDDNLDFVSSGEIGELYLAGNCLARGYLNRPDLSTQRFLQNPYQTEEDKIAGRFARIYKSGDLVRYAANGELEYMGRNDMQVKINGLRIEISEIETVLSEFSNVKQCAVLPKNRQNDPNSAYQYLVGYFVSQNNVHIREKDVQAFMQTKLPSYMIPIKFVRIDDKLPTTINGKLDTKAMPNIDFASGQEEYAAPRNAFEIRLCELWSEILGIENLGIDDDFFRLGGDSISVLQLTSRIRRQLDVAISIKDIFVSKSIRNLVDDVLDRDRVKKTDLRTEQGLLNGNVSMLPIQKWFFEKGLTNLDHWNQSFAIRTPTLNLQKLKNALGELIAHHDAFRLRYRIEEDSYVQYYDAADSIIALETFDVRSGLNLNEVLTEWQGGLNIETGPLFVVAYLYGYDDGSARVWFALHHLIVDTVSWRIICQDLKTLYNGGDLGRKGSSYRQWVDAVHDYANSQHAEIEKTLWRNVNRRTELFNRKLETLVKSRQYARTVFALTNDQTEKLLKHCNKVYETQINDLLLAALAYAINDLTRDRTNYVTLEGHGREEIDSSLDVSRTVGWFTIMYPVELVLGHDLKSTIQNIKKSQINVVIPNKGIGYGPIIGYGKAVPLVTFNYLGQFDSASDKPWNFAEISGDWRADRSANSQDAEVDAINVTGVCSNDQMRFNVAARLSIEETERFSFVFKSKLEEIVNCSIEVEDGQTEIDPIDEFDPYLEFGESNQTILFALPPGRGGGESYINNIVQNLTSFRLILFNNYYLHTKKSPTTYEKLAAFYIRYVKQIQPKGPYNFLGWSFGGVMALEISRQLIERGDKIDNLIFFDSYFNVRKASCDIGKTESYIFDQIEYLYAHSRKKEDFNKLASTAKNIVLYQAKKLTDMYETTNEKLLFEYYMNSPCNNLDTLLDRESFRLISMEDDTHTSWVFNKQLLSAMANDISLLF